MSEMSCVTTQAEHMDDQAASLRAARQQWRWLCLILLVGLVLRIVYLLEIKERPDFSCPIQDETCHDYWGRALATGDWSPPPGYRDPKIPETPFQRAPGYPYFLGLIYLVFGHGYLAPRIVQMGLGLLNVVLAFLFARKRFGGAVALVWAALMSFYWILLYSEGTLYDPTLLVTLTLLVLWSLSTWIEKVGFWRCFVSGVVVGVFSLVRVTIIMCTPACVLWLLWIMYKRKRLRSGLRSAVGFVAGIAVAISPMALRNYSVCKELVFFPTDNGMLVYHGNNPLAEGTNIAFPDMMEVYGLERWNVFDYPYMVERLGKHLGRELSLTEASAYWRKQGLDYARTHVRRTLWLCLRRMLLTWGPREIANPIDAEYDRSASFILSHIPGNFATVMVLAVLGLGLWCVELRPAPDDGPLKRQRRETLALILLFITAYSCAFIPIQVASRYRVPVLPVLLLFSSYGLCALSCMVRRGHTRRLAMSIMVAGVFAGIYLAVFTKLSLTAYDADLAEWHFQRAEAFVRRNMYAETIVEYEEALREQPDFAWAHNNLGLVLMKTGRCEEALEHYRQAVALRGDSPKVHSNMAMALAAVGKIEEALEHQRTVVRYEPDSFIGRLTLGLLLAEDGRNQDAVEQLSKAVILEPKSVQARFKLATLQAEQGDADSAVLNLREVLKLDQENAEATVELCLALAQQGNANEAAELYAQFQRAHPNHPGMEYRLAQKLKKEKRFSEAIARYAAIVKANPGFVPALIDLALLLATCEDPHLRNAKTAVSLGEAACRLTDFSDAAALDAVGQAYGEAGNSKAAAEAAEKALAFARKSGMHTLVGRLRQRLEQYRSSGSP